MITSLHCLVHFIHLEFLEIYYYSTKFRVQNLTAEWKETSIDNKQGSVCTHQMNPPHKSTPHALPTIGVNKP